MLVLACGMSPKQKAIEILQQGINDESIIVRVNAAKGLRQMGEEQGVEILYEIIRSEDEKGSAAALSALYDLGKNTYHPVIVNLAGHSDPLLRNKAYELISLMDDTRCREVLVNGTDDKIAKIRRVSYVGLEKFEEKDVITNGLRDIDPLVRIAAAKALGRLGEDGMENFIRNELKITDSEIRKHGVIALAEIGDTSAIPVIKEYLYTEPWKVRLAAVEALLILGNQDGVDALKDGLHADDPFAREGSVHILKKFRLPEGSQLLQEAIRDEYTNVSVAAIEALAQYRIREYQTLFAEKMDVSNPLVKIAAATAYLQIE